MTNGKKTVAQFKEELRDRVLAGAYQESNGKLPSVRELAARSGLSKNTVHGALEELAFAGLLVPRIRQGYFVRGKGGANGSSPLSDLRTTSSAGETYPGRLWGPPELYASEPLRRALVRSSQGHGEGALASQDAVDSGTAELADWASRTFAPDGSSVASNRRVLVTRGVRDALQTVYAHLRIVRPESRFGLLEPCAPMYRHLADVLGIRVVGFSREELEAPKALARRLGGETTTALVFNTTNSNPTGRTLTMWERHGLATLAEELAAFVVEVDPLRSFSSREERPQSVSSLVPDRSYFIDGASKFLGPTLPAGFLFAPDAQHHAIRVLRCSAGWSPDDAAVRVLNALFAEGTFWDHLRAVRAEFARRETILNVVLRDFEALGALDADASPDSPFRAFRFIREREEFRDVASSDGTLIHAPGSLFYSGSGMPCPESAFAWCRLSVGAVDSVSLRRYLGSFG